VTPGCFSHSSLVLSWSQASSSHPSKPRSSHTSLIAATVHLLLALGPPFPWRFARGGGTDVMLYVPLHLCFPSIKKFNGSG